ncbi:MAG: serine/threonine protein kinase [Lachnospiraceae bacterium]|nr:serine/threonine protein kinase [Lachnospiraceae bacterium]
MNDNYPLALPINTVLAGQYIVEKVLGQGGFGITYKALDRLSGKAVAVKEFFPDSIATRTQGQTTVMPLSGDRGENYAYGKECFLQEAETLAKFIGNENIVRIYSYFEEYGTAYFVMDFIEGTSLDEFIKIHGGKLSFEAAAEILIPVMDALADVHDKGIVHRDISPDNIYLTSDGKVKLIDFGAARQSLGDKSQSLDVVLKHGFAPKEQYMRRGKQGPFTDIYALGATFYYTLTGKRPPDSLERVDEDDIIPPSNLGVKISKEAEEAILMALNVQPEDRFQSMIAFKNAMMSVRNLETQMEPSQSHKTQVESPKTANDISETRDAFIPEKQATTQPDKEKKSLEKGRIILTIAAVTAVILGCLLFFRLKGETIPLPTKGNSQYPVIIGNNVNNLADRSRINVDSGAPGTVYVGRAGSDKGVNADEKNRFSCISVIDGLGYAMDGAGKAITFEMNGNEAINLQEIPELTEFNDIARFYVSKDYYFIYTIGNSVSHFYSVNRTDGSVAESSIKDLRADDITITDTGKFCCLDWNGEGSGSFNLFCSPAGAIDQIPEQYYTIPESSAGIEKVVSGGDDIVYVYLYQDRNDSLLNRIYKFDLSNQNSSEPEIIDVQGGAPLAELNCDGTNLYCVIGERKENSLDIEAHGVGIIDLNTGEVKPIYDWDEDKKIWGLTVYPDKKGTVSFFAGSKVVTVP